MNKPLILLLFAALIAAVGGLYFAGLGETEAPIVSWTTDDEVDGEQPEEANLATPEGGELVRSEVETTGEVAPEPLDDEPRVDAILRGRVIDKFNRPVADAKVWLEIGRSRANRGGDRGGRSRGRRERSRRIPEPVVTNAQGLFAFQGQTFRNLRVNLQVKHTRHAVGLFEKDVGDIQTTATVSAGIEVEIGDLVLQSGGRVRGRVTDLDGNGVAAAEVKLEPDFRNRLRWQRNREDLLPPVTTDNSGYYVCENVPADETGDFRITVTAKMHTPGRSDNFKVAEDTDIELPDIRLGPGYEVTGYVRDQRGEPIAGANVRLRRSLTNSGDEPRGREGRGGRGGREGRGGRPSMRDMFRGSRDSRTKTDEEGRFFLEHLAGVPMELSVDAKGFLDYTEDEVDVTMGRPIHVTMLAGLRITGTVQVPDGSPMERFAVRAVRLRNLPDPNAPKIDFQTVMQKLSKPDLSTEERTALMRQMRTLTDQFRGRDRGGRGRGGRGGDRGGRDGNKPEQHPGGRFELTGLQEGVYEVLVEADDFARFRSMEMEVRRDAAPPNLTITLDPGLYVAGVVVDDYGDPVVGAEIELRSATLEENQPSQNGNNTGDRNSRRFDPARMMQMWMRRSTSDLRLEAKTDEEGLFFVRHVPAGVYRVSAERDGFADVRGDAFQLEASRSDLKLQMLSLGSLVGTVTGFDPEEVDQTRVGCVLLPEDMGSGGFPWGRGRGGGRGFRNVTIEADGSYRIDDLTPGNYVIRSWVGLPQGLMRELGPSFFDGSLQADVVVAAGQETRYDLQLTRPLTGTVAGTVIHNGENANGFRIELRKQDNSGQSGNANGPGGRDMGRMMRFFANTQRATVDAAGRFEMKDVPVGNYTLQIRSGRRGGTLLEEPIQVLADVTTERNYQVQTASLTGTITTDDGSDAKDIGGRISLIPNATEVPPDVNRWLRENTSYDARVRNAGFKIDSAPPGNYLLVAILRDRETTSQLIALGRDETIEITAGKATTGQTNSANK